MKRTVTLKDDFFILELEKKHTHSINFSVFEVDYFGGENLDVPEFHSGKENHLFSKGMIKWDGCCDLSMGFGEDYQLHVCGIKGIRRWQLVFEELYKNAAEMMEDVADFGIVQ